MGLFRRRKKRFQVPYERDPEADHVRVVALSMHFEGKRVLWDIDLGIKRGEVFVVMGPSGCGKTTLLKHICGLLPPDLGTVYLDGRDIYLLPEDDLNKLRRRMGMSFQGGALINSMSVLDNVKLPIKESTNLPDALITTQARVKLDMVGLLHAAHLLPGDLSGGMRKRAAVARAMALDPEILFFDEPTSGLDPIMAAELDNLVLKLNQVFRITIVVVTHDLASAFTIADRITMLKDGRVLALGTREEIQASRNPEVQAFIRRSIEEAGEQGVDFTKYLVR